MNQDVIKVFVGYDPVESTAWHTFVHSILRQSTRPLAIIPINVANFKDIYNRKRDPKQSNEFSFARFLVPYLCDYKGYAVFFDCDMLLRCDISEIFDHIDKNNKMAVYVVKHDYQPKNEIKYLNTVQYKYPRKNWSSVVVWNCEHQSNKKVTPEYVNNASPIDLHRFYWLSDDEIGELDIKWNWLVGEYDNPPCDIKNIHWTVGGPYFKEYRNADFANEWFSENLLMNYCMQRDNNE